MVTALARAALRDVRGLVAELRGVEPPPQGLRAYLVKDEGGLRRLHLRLQEDGSGLLFVDVTDVIHLSPTAAAMAHLILEDTPLPRALASLERWFHGASRAELRGDYERMRRIVRDLSAPGDACRTCAVDLPRTPLFSTRAKAPHKVDLALTYACNNECPHCYNDPGRFDLQSLSGEDWKRVIDRLVEVGVPHLILTGGEATLHPALVDIVAHASGRGLVVGLNSNGRRLKHAPYTAALAAAGLDHVQITLESHLAHVHDAMVGAPRAFGQTVRGIETCLAAGLHTITNSTITRLNAGHVEETVELLHRLGLRTFAMNGMIYSGGGDRNPDALLPAELPAILVRVRDRARELGMRFLWYTVTEYCELSPVELEIGAKRCNAGEYSMCVEPNGDVLPCQSYYLSAGNLLADPWERIWKGELFRSFREREEDARRAGLPAKCWECPDLPLCGGGCRIEREARDGTGPGGCQSCSSGKLGGGGLRSSGASAGPLIPLARLARRGPA
jgi:radical SAM protein with 4Fe4S-binding SPASM domain